MRDSLPNVAPATYLNLQQISFGNHANFGASIFPPFRQESAHFKLTIYVSKHKKQCHC